MVSCEQLYLYVAIASTVCAVLALFFVINLFCRRNASTDPVLALYRKRFASLTFTLAFSVYAGLMYSRSKNARPLGHITYFDDDYYGYNNYNNFNSNMCDFDQAIIIGIMLGFCIGPACTLLYCCI